MLYFEFQWWGWPYSYILYGSWITPLTLSLGLKRELIELCDLPCGLADVQGDKQERCGGFNIAAGGLQMQRRRMGLNLG